MKIGKPNLLPSYAYLLSLVGSIFCLKSIIFDFDKLSKGTFYYLCILASISFYFLIFLSYNIKIVIFKQHHFIYFAPFRFFYKKHKYTTISSLNWEILMLDNRLGHFKEIIVNFNDANKSIKLSDLEFYNFNSIEKWLLIRINKKINLNKRNKIYLEQAKSNIWYYFIWLVLLLIFLISIATNEKNGCISHSIQVILLFLIFRISYIIIKYRKLIKKTSIK
jgi:hypothetical protein